LTIRGELKIVLATALFISACSIKQTTEQAEIPKGKELCIIENDKVRELVNELAQYNSASMFGRNHLAPNT
jgi:hypothetical protein